MSSLIGCWRLVTASADLGLAGEDEMQFKDEENLIYAVDAGNKWQLMLLTYRIDGEEIVSNQPSQPRYERSAFRFTDSGELVMKYKNGEAVFRRIPHLTIDELQA